MRNAFIDTNIYIAFSLNDELENSHGDCCYLFHESSFDVYSSLTVKQELNKILRRRKGLYRSLTKHLANRLPLEDFLSEFKITQNSDIVHMKKVIKILRNKQDALGYLRWLDRNFELGIWDGQNMTKEFIQRSNDGNCKSFFIGEGFHEPDNCIISDFIEWALPGDGCVFLTNDGGILSRKETIFRFIREYLYQDDNHIKVDHISSVKSRDR